MIYTSNHIYWVFILSLQKQKREAFSKKRSLCRSLLAEGQPGHAAQATEAPWLAEREPLDVGDPGAATLCVRTLEWPGKTNMLVYGSPAVPAETSASFIAPS